MIENLPKELFSSFRLTYVAYIIFIIFAREGSTSAFEFFTVSIVVMILTIIHDDFIRIKLNKWAEGKK
jgi:hypothetical protein